MKKLRTDLNITDTKISDAKLLPYVEQNTQNVVALLEMVDYGRNVAAFLGGSTNSIQGDAESIEEIEKAWWQNFILKSIMKILADEVALSAASTLFGTLDTIISGYKAYMAATVVLTAKETRYLLNEYCGDRYAGRTVDQAWQNINDPIYENLWNLITNLKNIPKDILKQKFEYAYSTYRLVGYPDSIRIRSAYGEAIVSLVSPVSAGNVAGKLHQNSASGPPLSGATVTCGGQSIKTASDGSFSLSGVTTGNQSISFSMSGYQPYSMSVLINAGQTTDVGDRWLVKNPVPPSPSCPSGNGLYCGDSSIGQNSNYLYLCTNGNYSLSKQCSNGCLQNPPGVNDTCRTASKTCPSGNGLYCGNPELGQNPDYLYQCTNGTYSIKTKCPYGCKVNPPGTNDVCFSQPTPTSTPDLNIDKVTVKKSGGSSTHTLSLLPGEAFQIDVWIKNVGEATASKEFTINYLLSNDNTFNKYDRVIGVDHVKDDIKEDRTYHDSKKKNINAPSKLGTYYIGAWVDSPQDNNKQNDFSKGDDERAKIIVALPPAPTYRISGTVYYSSLSNPLSGVKVELISGTQWDPAIDSTITDLSGMYSFANVPNGSYFIRAYGPTSEYLTANDGHTTIQGSDMTNVDIPLWKKLSLFSPSDGSTITNQHPEFCWQGLPEAAGYTLQLNVTSDWNLVEMVTIPGTCYTTSATLQEGISYTWHIVALNQSGIYVGGSVPGYSFTVAGAPSRIELPRTGQTRCYDSAGIEIDCTGTGQDGEIQAGVAWPNPRFTDNSDGTMTDNLTGLVWAKDAGTPPLATCLSGEKTWQGALDYITCLNTNGYLGYSDWRLPNVNELESMGNANESHIDLWLIGQGFVNVHSFFYWTSTQYQDDTCALGCCANAWAVQIPTGAVEGSYILNPSLVWPVRGQPLSAPSQVWKTGQTISCRTGDDGSLQQGIYWPIPRFTDAGDEAVTDNLTGLTWAKDGNAPGASVCQPGIPKTWQGGLDHVKCLNTENYLGHNDWRLPNRKEIRSIADYSQDQPGLPLGHPFTNVPSSAVYWSSTGILSSDIACLEMACAWGMIIDRGGYLYPFLQSESLNIWPVRGGQPPSAIYINTPSGTTWVNVSSVYSSVSSQYANRIYCSMSVTYDGTEPPDPPVPTAASHDYCVTHTDTLSPNPHPCLYNNGEYITCNSGPFELFANSGEYKKIKIIFRSYNDIGYTTSDLYSYTIDNRL